jgi:hypothetical protein
MNFNTFNILTVLTVLVLLKRQSSAGPVGVNAETIQSTGDSGIDWMTDLSNSI